MWSICCMLCITPVVFIILKPAMKQLHKFLYACFFNYGQPILDGHVRVYKKEIFAPLDEENNKGKDLVILEIGAGSGANLDYVPRGSTLVCVEPSSHMRRFFRRNYKKCRGINLRKLIHGVAENMSEVEDASIDAVIASFVMCSVRDLPKCLAEIRRVLKPGGKFCYLEHTLDSDKTTWTYASQRFTRSIWPIIFDGCKPLNDPQPHVDRAQFSSVVYKTDYMNMYFLPMRRVTYGIATK